MKKLIVSLVLLILVTPMFAAALTSGEARDDWRDAKKASTDKQAKYADAKLDYASDPTEENNQKVINAGKDVLYAALDEAEAWLIWKQLEAEENEDVPQEIKDNIESDVETNLDMIDGLRTDVDNIDNKLELGVTFLKMIGKYFELLADVARNTGAMWSYIGELQSEKINNFEEKLRATAENIDDNEEIIEFLDLAKEQLDDAENNIAQAKNEYQQVKIPGQPLIKFANGNNYLTVAKGNLLSAHSYLNQAYLLIVSRGE